MPERVSASQSIRCSAVQRFPGSTSKMMVASWRTLTIKTTIRGMSISHGLPNPSLVRTVEFEQVNGGLVVETLLRNIEGHFPKCGMASFRIRSRYPRSLLSLRRRAPQAWVAATTLRWHCSNTACWQRTFQESNRVNWEGDETSRSVQVEEFGVWNPRELPPEQHMPARALDRSLELGRDAGENWNHPAVDPLDWRLLRTVLEKIVVDVNLELSGCKNNSGGPTGDTPSSGRPEARAESTRRAPLGSCWKSCETLPL